MIATWMAVSRRRATNREPSPASTSSSVTPSGVAIVTRSSRSHMCNLDEFVRDRTPTWSELAAARRRGRRASRAGSAPTACAGSARVTASAAADLAHARRRFPVGSRGRATRRARATRPARGVPHDAEDHDAARVRRRTGTGAVYASVRRCSSARSCASRSPTCSRATGRGAIPAPAAGSCRAGTSRSPNRARRARTSVSPSTSKSDLAARSSRTTSGDVPRVRGRHAARDRHALRVDHERRAARRGRGTRDRRGQRPAVLRTGARARRARAELHRGVGLRGVPAGERRSSIPGTRTRGAALRNEARAAVEIVLGTMSWLVVAGLVEGFLTPAGAGSRPSC